MRWWQNETKQSNEFKNTGVLICDLAAGSGEVTIALQEWWETCRARAVPTIPATNNTSQVSSVPAITPRPAVAPSRPIVARPSVGRPSVSRPTQTVTSNMPLNAPFPLISTSDPVPRIVAVDPYTADAYLQRTGLPCIALSFQDVAQDGLPPAPTNAQAEVQPDGGGSAPQPESGVTESEKEVGNPESAEPDPSRRELYDLVICCSRSIL